MCLQHFTMESGSVWNARARWFVRNIPKTGKVVSHLPFPDAHASALFSVYFRQLCWSSQLFCNQAYTQIFNSLPAPFSDTHIETHFSHPKTWNRQVAPKQKDRKPRFPTFIDSQAHFHTHISEEVCAPHFITSPLFLILLLGTSASCTWPRASNESHLLIAKPSPYVLLIVDESLCCFFSFLLFLPSSHSLLCWFPSTPPSLSFHMLLIFLINKKLCNMPPQLLVEGSGARMSGYKACCAISKLCDLG